MIVLEPTHITAVLRMQETRDPQILGGGEYWFKFWIIEQPERIGSTVEAERANTATIAGDEGLVEQDKARWRKARYALLGRCLHRRAGVMAMSAAISAHERGAVGQIKILGPPMIAFSTN